MPAEPSDRPAPPAAAGRGAAAAADVDPAAANAARAAFYDGVPVFGGFERVADEALYVALPDDWVIGLSDVVASTRAIADGRYGAVNMAGAAAIAAVANALGDQDFPFVFGGDGASFALPGADAETARTALAATAAWVRDDLGLELRTALVPVKVVRAAGLDVRVARFAASPAVSYAMVMGGGLAWAAARMKAGEFGIAAAAAGTKPDLSGLSCRFAEVKSERGTILSVIVEPRLDADGRAVDHAGFLALVGEVLALADLDGAGRPLPAGGPPTRWPPKGLALEILARRPRGGSLALTRLKVIVETLLSWAVFRFRLGVRGFDPARYIGEVVQNSDFRKFDDGLRLTVDSPPAVADAIEARLKAATAIARHGLHRQDAAVVTCYVPSAFAADHVHFVDGARGGYASAALALKAG